ncbi:MAG: U32 family peptidase [Lachnospiraceae bacterium]|nr:U32 family peptidase [Lachnospiraceae bacterium]
MAVDIKLPEVLAPAGSLEGLYAAVNAGCDAVYIGGSRFGARAYADNPGEDDMIKAIEYCHLHGVKIYMTVNTLLKEMELFNGLYNYMKPYYEAGLDAAIVQDTGVMLMLHKWFPDLELHASTQMTITMGKSASVLKKYGVTRIVPARELTIKELQAMREDTDLEIEVFVHGALCYCYSGQCLFSSMLGGRSGNRGRCAQPCRMQYEIQDGNNKRKQGDYILSPKELCSLEHIGELIEAGVDSLKIEGRMKRPEYTAAVTAAYRKYVDLYRKYGKAGYDEYITGNKSELQKDIQRLAEIYNREGFTGGYMEGKAGVPFEKRESGKGVMLASKRPKHGGMCVGKVVKVDKGSLTYKVTKDIGVHDVLEFRDDMMTPEYEYTTGEAKKAGELVTARYQKGCVIHAGDSVYRTKNAMVLDDIKTKYINENKKIPINGIFEAGEGAVSSFTVWHDDISVTVYGGVCEKAGKRPACEEDVRKVLNQLGNTEFVFENLDIMLEGELFLPVGVLKNLRREAVCEIRDVIVKRSRRVVDDRENNISKEVQEISEKVCESANVIACVMTKEQFDAAVNSQKVNDIYLKTELMSDSELRECLYECDSKGCYIVMPHIFRKNVWDNEEQKAVRKKSIYQENWTGFVIRNLEEYVFLKDVIKVSSDKIVTDAGLYTMNEMSAEFWLEEGVHKRTLPIEMTGREMRFIPDKNNATVIVYSHIPMMVSAQCTLYNTKECAMVSGKGASSAMTIKDKKDREFIIANYCKYCYNTIYEKVPMDITSFCDEMREMGVGSFRYDFTVESGDDTAVILSGNYSGDKNTGHYIHGVE